MEGLQGCLKKVPNRAIAVIVEKGLKKALSR